MNLQRKLEEIRRKPEHIKLRYTYIAVGISMFFILLLWFFSIADTINKSKNAQTENAFQDLQVQKKSLKDATTEITKSLNDLNSNLQKTTSDTTQTTPDNTNQTLPSDIQTAPSSTTPTTNDTQALPDKNRPTTNNMPSSPPSHR